MYFPCTPGIVDFPLDVCKNNAKAHGYVLETRDACPGGGGAAGKSAEFALATERFLDPQTGLALLICRARRRTHGTTRTSRTSRDAYAKRDNAKTSNSELEFPVGEPSVLHPQPPIYSGRPHCTSKHTQFRIAKYGRAKILAYYNHFS